MKKILVLNVSESHVLATSNTTKGLVGIHPTGK